MENDKDIQKEFGLRKVLIPILIGLFVSGFLLYNNLNQNRFEYVGEGLGNYALSALISSEEVDFTNAEHFVNQANGSYEKLSYSDILSRVKITWHSFFWLFMAILGMIVRDLAYMVRIKYLTDNSLSWRKSFDVIMLWEFASAVTPSVVGGSGVAVYILNREKIPLGKSTAIVMVTAMLDEIFYLTMVPLVILIVGSTYFFPDNMQMDFIGLSFNIKAIFWIGFSFIFLMTASIAFGIIFKPRETRKLLAFIFSLPVLRRWKWGALRTGNDIAITSAQLRGKKFNYWITPVLATYLSWTFRYLVVNFLILAFTDLSLLDNVVVYARQLGMWVITLISPTPGGSGIAELAFNTFLKEFIPFGLAGTLAILWRIISYYPYLFLGSLVLPAWVKRTKKENVTLK